MLDEFPNVSEGKKEKESEQSNEGKKDGTENKETSKEETSETETKPEFSNRDLSKHENKNEKRRIEYPKPDLSKLTPSELEQRVKYYDEKIREEKQKIRFLIESIEKKRMNVDSIKKDRDNLNMQVKEIIAEAKKKIEQRDEYHKKIALLKEERKKLEESISPHIQKITEMKKIRDKYNEYARGSAELLKKKVEESFKTLIEFDLSLKDEITLFDITMELSDRYYAKKNADKVHAEMQKYYDENIKSTDEKIEAITKEIQQLHEKAQALHEEAMADFKKKDELKKESDKVHNQVVETSKSRAEVQAEINAHRQKIDEYIFLKECHLRELRRLESLEHSKKKRAQVEAAKQKLERKGKIGLEELKVLLESGQLKNKEKNIDER